jgi:hypothetical protein
MLSTTSRPGRIAGPLLAISLASALVLGAAPVRAFEVFRHVNMTSEVLTRQGVSGSVLSLMKDGAMWPDVWGCTDYCYCPTWAQVFCTPPSASDVLNVLSPDHFDNNRLVDSINRVNSRIGVARGTLLNAAIPFPNDNVRRAVAQSCIDFGKALHTVQDFYAHSTYLELNVDLIRVSGDVTSVGLWNGESYDGDVIVGTTLVSGIQTGYVEIAPPPGSVTHDVLNKDKPGSIEGSLGIYNVFGSRLATYYETVSGQFGGTTNPYTDNGLAPRHTIKAYNSLLSGSSVFDFYPMSAKKDASRDPRAAEAEEAAIQSVMAAANADPYFQALAAQIQSVLSRWDGSDPTTFPLGEFDANGFPIVSTDVASQGTLPQLPDRMLEQNVPNPFNPRTSITFRVAVDGNVSLRIYDARGRTVRTLADQDYWAGSYTVTWDGTTDGGEDAPSGRYLYRLCQADRSEARSMVLAR